MSDENLFEAEVILRETLWDNESIDITAVKQENGDTYAFFNLCFGKIDLEFDITELQEHLDRYSFGAKEVSWICVQFRDNVRYREIYESLYKPLLFVRKIRTFSVVLSGV